MPPLHFARGRRVALFGVELRRLIMTKTKAKRSTTKAKANRRITKAATSKTAATKTSAPTSDDFGLLVLGFDE
jgi:hypothetical protein